MSRFIIVGCLMFAIGCNSTPGYRIGWELYRPPTMNATSPLAPVATMPQTAYMIEAPSNPPMMRRQYAMGDTPADPMPVAASRRPCGPEQLPMPRQNTAAMPTCP